MMAVQAQFPSPSLLPDFRSRVRSIDGSLDNLHSPAIATANLFRTSNTVEPVNFLQQSALKETDNENFLCNLSGSRKRSRETEDMMSRQHAFIPTIDLDCHASASPVLMSQPAPIAAGLRLSLDDSRLNSPNPSTSGRRCAGSFITSILSDELQSQMSKQNEEIDQLIKIQGERMKQALEDKRKRQARTLLSTIEESFSKRMKLKDEELDRARRRNMELEERVKQLILEAQLWQNLAKNNELMASNLRNSLEQVVAQSRELSREGCGESEVEDAESCQIGEGGDAHARTFKENKELKEQRTCRMCRTNNVSILLLPCRHLCLCKDCEGCRDVCPLCGTVKNASVQVYMS